MKKILLLWFTLISLSSLGQSLSITSNPPVMCPGLGATLNATGVIDNRVLNFPRTAGQEMVLNNVQNYAISNFTYEFWFQTTDSIVFLTEHIDGQFIYDGQSGQNYAVFPQQVWSPTHRRSSGISVGKNGISVIEHSHQFIASRMNYVAPLIGWHHCAVVYTNNNFELFIDGTSVGGRSNGSSYTDNGYGMPLTVACRPNLGNQYPAVAGVDADPNDRFLGQLDEFRVWNTSLTAAQISAIYNRKLTNINMSGNIVNMVFDMNTSNNASTNYPSVTVTGPTGPAGVSYPLVAIPQIGGFSGPNLASSTYAPITLTYAWTNGVLGNTQTVNPSNNTTYTCAVTYGLGVVTSSYTLAISNTQASITSSSTTLCQGDSLLLTANTGTNYLWSNGATTQSIYVNDANSYSVSVTNTDNCIANSNVVTPIVNPTPNAVISANGETTFCDGNSVVLTSTASDAYLWSNGSTTPSVTVSQTDTLQVTLTNSFNCSSTSNSILVTVNPKPIAQYITDGPLTFCEGTGVHLIASGGTPLWNNTITTDTLYVTSADSIVLYVSNSFGCSDTTWAITHVWSLPVVSTQADTAICISSTDVIFQASPSAGTWNGNGISNNAFTPTAVGDAQLLYSYTDANGCVNEDSLLVHVADFTPVSIGNDMDMCLPVTNIDLSANATPSGGTWTGIGISSNGILNMSTEGNEQYHYTLSDVCQSSEALTIHFHATPEAPIIGGSTHICKNVPSPLWSNYVGGNSWSNSTTTDTTYISVAGLYTLTYTNEYGCSSSSSLYVAEFPDVQVPQISGSNLGIYNTSSTYSVIGMTNYNYDWQVLGGTIISGQGTNSIEVIWDQFSQGNASVNLTWSNEFGCENSNSTGVSIVPTSVEEIFGEEFSIYPNPTNGNFIVSGKLIQAITLVQLYDMTGQLITSKNIEGNSTLRFDVSELSNGIYLIQIKNGNTTYCRQLVIAK